MRLRSSLTRVFVMLFMPWQILNAQWSTDPYENTPVCTASGNQEYPQIVSDGTGGAIMVWMDKRNGTDYDIYAQHFNSLGVAQWSSNGVAICTAAADQQQPRIISDGRGGALITWGDRRSGVTNTDIYAQRISAAGTTLWTSGGVVICGATNHQYISSYPIVGDGSAGAIITWDDLRNGNANGDTYAQRIDSSGTVLWTPDGVVICSAVNSQGSATLTVDDSGGAIISWTDNRAGSQQDIYAQRVNSLGAAQWSVNGIAVSAASGNQLAQTICSNGTGGAIISWRDKRNGSNDDIYAQRLNGSGVPQWTTDGISVCTAAGDQASLGMVSDGSSGAIAVWVDNRAGITNPVLYAQRITPGGSMSWTANGVAVTNASGYQSVPSLTGDGIGGAYVVWADDPSGVDAQIRAQHISNTGVKLWLGGGVAVSLAANYQYYPKIVKSTDGAILVWEDARAGNGNRDIYAQHVFATGNLDPPEQTTSWQSIYPYPTGNDLYSLHAFDGANIIVAGGGSTILSSADSGKHWRTQFAVGGSNANDLYDIAFANDSIGVAVGQNTQTKSTVIVRTTDGGLNWNKVFDELPGFLFKVCFIDQNTGFAVGTKDKWLSENFYGPIMLRTSDGGENWAEIDSLPTSLALHAIGFLNSNFGVAVGSHQSVIRTTDGGAHWLSVAITPIPGYGDNAWFSVVGIVDSATAIIAGPNPRDYLKTTDKGESWTSYVGPSGGGTATSALFILDAHNWFWGTNYGNTHTTTDGGITWNQQFYVRSCVNNIVMMDSLRGYLVSIAGKVSYTEDGWKTLSYRSGKSTAHIFTQSWPNSDTGYVAGGGGSALFKKTTNGGKSWSDVETPIFWGNSFGAINFYDNNLGIATVFTLGDILRTTDGGLTWAYQYLDTAVARWVFSHIQFADSTTAYACGYGLYTGDPVLLKSTDRGATWFRQGTSLSGYTGHIEGMQFLNAQVGFLSGNSNYGGGGRFCIKTTDGGATWSDITPTGVNTYGNYYDISFLDAMHGYLAGSYGPSIFRTSDGGTTWTELSHPFINAPDAFKSVYFLDYNRGFVSLQNVGTILYTTDAGTTWETRQTSAGTIEDMEFSRHGSSWIGTIVGDGIDRIVLSPYSIKSWVGAVDSSWDNTNNWNPPGIPLTSDSVVIGSNGSNPVIYVPQDQITIAALTISSGGHLSITDALGRFVVLGDVMIEGTFEIRPGTRTQIICGGKWIGQETSTAMRSKSALASNGGFIPSNTTVSFSSKGVFDGNFYNLIADESSLRRSGGDVLVENKCTLLEDIRLSPRDRLFIASAEAQAIEGPGKILNGTISRAIKPGSIQKYRFESERSYVKFDGSGTTPLTVAIKTRANESPRAFNLLWKQVASSHDSAANIVRGSGITSFSKWAIGVPRPTSAWAIKQGSTIVPSYGTPTVARMYEIKQEGGNNFSAELQLRYENPEVAGGSGAEDSLVLLHGPFVGETMNSGWNLLSLPVVAENALRQVVLPGASSSAFAYENGYQTKDTLEPGKGYWVKFPYANEAEVSGDELEERIITVHGGWNLIGSLSFPISSSTVTSNPPGIIISSFFGYSGGYFAADSLMPFNGYWAKTSSDGQIILDVNATLFAKGRSSSAILSRLNILSISDSTGSVQRLYFGSEAAVDVRSYEAPPLPPRGIFDVRYSSQRLVELSDTQKCKAVPIEITSAIYPITINWDINEKSSCSELVVGGKEISLQYNGKIEINEPGTPVYLRLSPRPSAVVLPKEYVLYQNYPNPFNPLTIIRYQLPVNSLVTVKIYDILGREVKTVVSEMQDAGYKSVQWDGSHVASGIYFYRIEAVGNSRSLKSFTQVKKMVLLK